MAQREWVEKDFYKELGVSSDASAKEIKRPTASSLPSCIRTRIRMAPRRFKAVSEAYSVLSDEAKRKEYDETRRLFAGGVSAAAGTAAAAAAAELRRIRRRRRRVQPERPFRRGRSDRRREHRRPVRRVVRPWRTAAATQPGRGAATTWRPRPSCRFMEATKGVAMPLRLTSPAPCTNCHGSGARPGTSPKVCPNCNGAGVINRNQGAFGFSEPCTECRGSGSIIEQPCDECKGTGVTTRTRTINVRIPPGVEDGQRIRLAGQGEAGLRGAPSGDLYVTVHVKPDKVFGRDGNDLTVTVPVSFTRTRFGHNAFSADAGGQGRRPGAEGHVGRPHPPGARSRCSQAVRRTRRPVGHREGRGATENRW